jgi:NitT/TauT family transport system ATP-binding protein
MIALTGCSKAFPSPRGRVLVPALEGIDLRVADHEFVCVLGPSGCGKTTLLRLMAGLVAPDAGEIRIDGRPVVGPGPERAMVFQDFALLPWADVLRNVGFGLELRGVPGPEREARARELIEAVGLGEFIHHRPGQLSGGMQQRVGLARALAVDPSILLMDEPFGSLDALTRRSLQVDLLRLHHRHRKTVVFVTHSVDEAVRLGDRIVLLTPRPGRVDETIDVDLPRPRPADLAARRRFIEIKEHLWSRLIPPPTAGEA